ncbi:MAG: hypothetical protein ACE5HO_21535, partial [bacterium]
PNGELYATWAVYDDWGSGVYGEDAIGFNKSTNGGGDWGIERRILNIQGIRDSWTHKNPQGPNAPIGVNSFPAMAVDRSGGIWNGSIYLVWADKRNGDPDILLSKSTNGGTTWSSPIRVNDDVIGNGKDQWFPWITVSPYGLINIVFCDSRNDPNNQLTEVWVAQSSDGGQTFANFKASDVAFTPYPIPGYRPGYMGDYIGITSKAGKAYACWMDNRNFGTYQVFVDIIDTYQAYLLALAYSNKSIDSDATAHNSGRRLVRDTSGNYHLVFGSGGEIFYRKLIGSTWQTPQRLSSGNGNDKFPSVTIRNSRIYVTWQRKSGTTHDLYFHKSDDGGATWPSANRKTLATSVGSADPLPVIAAYDAGAPTYKVILVYRKSDGLYWRGSTSESASSWSTAAKVSGTGSASKGPALNYFNGVANVTWDENNQIYQSSYNGSWSSQFSVSSGASGTTNHKNASSAFVAQGNLHVAWEALDTPVLEMQVVLHRVKVGSSWSAQFYEITHNDDIFHPSITGHTADDASLVFYRVGGNVIYKARFDGSTWTNPQYVKLGANYPSASIANPPGAAAKVVWTEIAGPPHKVEIDPNLTLQKVVTEVAADGSVEILNSVGWTYFRRAVLEDTLSGGSIAIQMSEITLTTEDGSVFWVPFTPAPDSLFALDRNSLWDLLTTMPVTLPADVLTIDFDRVMFSENSSKLGMSESSVEYIVQIVEPRTGTPLFTFPAIKPVEDGLFKLEDRVSQNIQMLANKEVALKLKINGLKSAIAGENLALIHVYRLEESVQPKMLAQQSGQTNSASPRSFALEQNYPNPFNPSTEIKYELPENGHVTLTIFNIIGQRVRTLVDEQLPAGYYNALW